MDTNWISILEQEPKDISGRGTYYIVTVECNAWNQKITMIMKWREEIIYGEIKKRWEWEGATKPEEWKVTHWSKFPRPAED